LATDFAATRAGAAVALAGRREDRLQALAARIEDEGARAFAAPTDVSDEDQATRLIQRVHDRLGGLDVLVNNAGLMLSASLIVAEASLQRPPTTSPAEYLAGALVAEGLVQPLTRGDLHHQRRERDAPGFRSPVVKAGRRGS
jgi:NAD(P)-dependent dehydrogenase (short-subunit alcohol dehydrogenase family)